MPRPAAYVLALVLALVSAPAFARASQIGAGKIDAGHARRLAHLVEQDCGACHGMTRKGGLGSPITAKALAGADPEALTTIILDGVPGTAMPPWRPLLTEDEARWIAEYLLEEPEK